MSSRQSFTSSPPSTASSSLGNERGILYSRKDNSNLGDLGLERLCFAYYLTSMSCVTLNQSLSSLESRNFHPQRNMRLFNPEASYPLKVLYLNQIIPCRPCCQPKVLCHRCRLIISSPWHHALLRAALKSTYLRMLGLPLSPRLCDWNS